MVANRPPARYDRTPRVGRAPSDRFRDDARVAITDVEQRTERGRDLLAVGGLLAPAAVYLAVRVTGLLVLAAMAAHDGTSLGERLASWDGDWLLSIARYGYAGVPDDHLDAFGNHTPVTPYGFFPGYPLLVSAIGVLTGGNLLLAGLAVSLVAGLVAAYGLTALGTVVPGGSRRAGLILVALFAAMPMAVVLSMTYTEALFCALAVWALVGVLREQWLLAGLCAAGAGLVRPTGNAVAAAVVLAAIVAIVTHRGTWRTWVGGLLGGAGIVGYLAYVGVQAGRWDAWFRIQREGWGWYFDGGGGTAEYVAAVLGDGERLFDVAIVVALVVSIALFVVAVATRMPWPLLVYAFVVLVTVWGTEGLMNAKLRLLVPAFVLLVPVAVGLAGRRTSTAVSVLVGLALASAWYGGYALTIWPYAI